MTIARFWPLLLLLLTGCTREQTDGSATVIQFAYWVPIVGVVGSLIAIVAGFAITTVHKFWGIFIIVIAVIFLCVIIPGMFRDFVAIDDDHFHLRTGFWWAPTEHDVAFKNLKLIQHVSVTKHGRRTSTSYYLDCYDRNGTVHRVPVGDLMKQCRDRILEKASAKGVIVVDRAE